MSEKTKQKNNYASTVSAISGICGASVGKVFVHPIDTVKAKI